MLKGGGWIPASLCPDILHPQTAPPVDVFMPSVLVPLPPFLVRPRGVILKPALLPYTHTLVIFPCSHPGGAPQSFRPPASLLTMVRLCGTPMPPEAYTRPERSKEPRFVS